MKKMRWMLAVMLGAMLALSACGSKKSETETTGAAGAPGVVMETTEEETNPENGLPLSKQPDPTAPVLASIVVYAPDENGKISGVMDAADELTEQNVLDLLVAHGTLAEGVKFVSLDKKDSAETAAVGPGASSDSTEKLQDGTLTLEGFAAGSGLDEETAKQAVIDTFKENYELANVELVLN